MKIARDFLTFFMLDNTTPTNGQRVVLGLMFLGYLFSLAVVSPFIALGWCGDKLLRAMDKRVATVFLLMFLIPAMALAGPVPASTSPQQYIESIAPHAAVVADYGFPPSVAIAQSCRETGFGKHLDDLDIDGNPVRQYNNVLGKKWHYGKYFIKLTPEGWGPTREYVPRRFQVYDSLAECFYDYAENITNNPAYANKDTSSREAFIRSIAPKYATDNPEAYAGGVLRIIREYELEKYDRRE